MARFPYESEIQQAVSLLINQYKIPYKILMDLVGTEHYSQLTSILDTLGENKLTEEELAKILVVQKGSELFMGSSEAVRELRLHLLRRLDVKDLVALYERNPDSKRKITSPGYMATPLSTKKWSPGKRWARDFVTTLKFPLVFAGIENDRTERAAAVTDIEPRKIIPPLVPYQESLKQKMLEVLNQQQEKTRCIVTLPTGGGKTRIAVESFIDWLQPRFAEGKYMIWIAQGEELCEQAIACISDMWQEREFAYALRVYRYFGGSTVELDDLVGGVVVGSIQQIVSRINSGDSAFEEIIRNCGAMIIDEAHHATAASYNDLIDYAKRIVGEDLFPICGLTATPGRNMDQTSILVEQFQANLIRPKLPEKNEYKLNPLLYFQEQGYLAKPQYLLFKDEPIEWHEDLFIDGEVSSEFLRDLSNNRERNLKIIDYMLGLPLDSSVLVYACTVEHAEFLTTVLNAIGKKAACISAKTPKAIRRMHIQAFKKKEIQYLFNYGVLTTGFDAPKVDHLLICRPTSSMVLYEQMVGRGLRGPKFGGTENCKIVDFSANIHTHGKPLAYSRFTKEWLLLEEVSSK
ncbi:DEAD/DEAH box helicase [Solibacillus merdavium]|uniref:DEAD/DEAH box helicase n=1 Tax=Solibacillus merdavium TaxID=2762218 RepID=A0ABR8XLX4_9BACL|nr:DEAD/DEAH box helicase [Solibacillus merdavium]MBD8032917.1 DEAD/DEAH box helicase [Solibacillus merdavium]